ncbi:MAG: DNA repair protein RadC [Thermoanaerobaculia bacterium]
MEAGAAPLSDPIVPLVDQPRTAPPNRERRMQDIPPAERPREKLLARGASALEDDELLAIILGTGLPGKSVLSAARELLLQGGLPGLFARGGADLTALVSGIGPAKAARVEAVLEIARRVTASGLVGRDLMSDPESAARYLMLCLASETREVMGGLLLDAKNRLIKMEIVFKGTGTHAAVAPSPLFRQAILAGAVGLIIFHNHPSGDPEPSADDRATTDRFVAAGREIGIEVRDHLVIGRGRWVSFHRLGLLRG